MRLSPRVGLLLAVAGVVGCAKPVAPIVEGPARSAILARDAAGHGFELRLKFVGAIVGDPRAVYWVTPASGTTAPLDSVPVTSILRQIQWRRVAGTDIVPIARVAEIESPIPAEDAGPFAPGNHQITLAVPDRLGGGTVTVRFFVGLSPDTWWAGPDPSRWPVSSDGDGRAVDVTDWAHFTTVPAWPPDDRDFFGPDSFRFLPVQRLPVAGNVARRTFYEISGNRIYARAEGDTVHYDSWIVACSGGFDWDSAYEPKVDPSDPGLPPGYQSDPLRYALLLPQGIVGSPIGFRTSMGVRTKGMPGDPDGLVLRFPQTSTYPAFLPASVFRSPRVAGYWHMLTSGKIYLLVRAEDSGGLLDNSVDDPVRLADLVDAGGGTPAERAARRKVLTFWVRPAPIPVAARSTGPTGRPGEVGGD